MAPETPVTAVTVDAINMSFVFVCAVLVVLMQIGFAMLETGLNARKNAANILFKNLMDLCVGALLYFFIGYRIMFPEAYHGESATWWNSLFPEDTPEAGIHWFYQMAFAATAATIVSGAVAGRMQFRAYLIYSGVLAGFVYPIVGRVFWSDASPVLAIYQSITGVHDKTDIIHDLAGSVVVHGVGGVTALAAVCVLRPRQGRFVEGFDFQGHHNLVFALLGTMLLWVGWYGFNAGSIDFLVGETDEETLKGISAVSKIVVNTTLGAVSGALCGMIFGLIPNRSYLNLKAAMNGALGGLVSITASCNVIGPIAALIIGGVAGLLVVIGEMLLESWKKDDTVGAFPVHGLCGIWGGMAVVIFSDEALPVYQIFAIVVTLGLVGLFMFAFFGFLKQAGWLEVSLEEEKRGLDISEHNMSAYE